jgi:hypothetical protein
MVSELVLAVLFIVARACPAIDLPTGVRRGATQLDWLSLDVAPAGQPVELAGEATGLLP